MICPTCGTHIPDGSFVCPACHASVSMTVAMPQLQGRWCPSCGALMGWEDEVCPSCGLPVERAWGAPQPEQPADQASEGADAVPVEPTPAEAIASEADDTRSIPRIESAIPAERDPQSKVVANEGMPSRRSLTLAVVASALLICGIALAITHPWNPDAFSIKATQEADTSMAGFPGTVEALSGQDSNGSPAVEVLTGDDATYAQLSEAYGKLGSYARRADESEELFGEVGFGTNLDERTRGKREAEALAIDVSNLIDGLGEVDVTSGTYVTELEHLTTLGNWLRNRVDGLLAAWRADLESENPAAEEQRLRSILAADVGEDGRNAYKALFDDNYDAWAPERKDGSE